jgi:hypothetical protein
MHCITRLLYQSVVDMIQSLSVFMRQSYLFLFLLNCDVINISCVIN